VKFHTCLKEFTTKIDIGGGTVTPPTASSPTLSVTPEVPVVAPPATVPETSTAETPEIVPTDTKNTGHQTPTKAPAKQENVVAKANTSTSKVKDQNDTILSRTIPQTDESKSSMSDIGAAYPLVK